MIDYISAHEASHLMYLSGSFSFKPLRVLAIFWFSFNGPFVFPDSRPALSHPDGQWAEQKNDPFFPLFFSLQPNPSNKLAIIHILGLLSNLFTTLDISKQDDESADSSAPPVKTAPPPPGPNPVSHHTLSSLWEVGFGDWINAGALSNRLICINR